MNDSSLDKLFIYKLLSSGLDFQDANALGMIAKSIEETARLDKSFNAQPSIQLPFFNIKGEPILDRGSQFYRIRYLYTFEEEEKAEKENYKLPSYRQIGNTGNHLYLPRLTNGFNWCDICSNPDIPLLITEGELKAAKACKEGYPTIGVCGVWNFKQAKKGEFLLDEFKQFNLINRKIYVCYDSDMFEKPQVLQALYAFTEELEQHGALPHVMILPTLPGAKKTGLDDFLVFHEENGVEKLDEIISKATYCGITHDLFRLNEQYCYVQHPGVIVFAPTGVLLQKEKFKDALLNKSVMKRRIDKYGKESFKKVNIGQEWLGWEMRKSAHMLSYEPGGDEICREIINGASISKFNTWRGWACEPKKGDISDFIHYFNAITLSLSDLEREWLLSWLAYPIQNPGIKLFTAVVLYSEKQGNGKTLLGHIIGHLYGDHYELLTKERMEDKNFNEWAVDKSFILADEITGGRDRRSLDAIKLMITQNKILVNRKNVNLYSIQDRINYIFATNHADALPLEENDRRFFVVEVPAYLTEKELNDLAISYEAKSEKLCYLFDFLLNYPISKHFNPFGAAPSTEAKNMMREFGQSDLRTFIKELPDEKESKVRDFITTDEALFLLRQSNIISDNNKKKITRNGIAREFKMLGFERLSDGKQFMLHGDRYRFFILRNNEKWQKATNDEILSYFSLYRIRV